MSNLQSQPVKRVLVMLDYGHGSDEVFDITALTEEIYHKSKDGHAVIELKVQTSKDYADGYIKETGKYTPRNSICWNAMIDFKSSGDAGHLDDAINAGMSDSFTTENLRKKLRAVQKKADKLKEDIQIQRLHDAAAIRHQHPIARVIIETKQLT